MSRARLHGIPASPGVAIGPVVVVDRSRIKARKRSVPEDQAADEVARFDRATDESIAQLDELADRLGVDAEVGRSIVQAHKLMLLDDALVGATQRFIRERGVNAEWALREVCSRLADMFESLDDPYLRERGADIDFVAQRLLRNLTGHGTGAVDSLDGPAVLVAHDLSPADTADMLGKPVLGFATSVGSVTSHTAIIARSLEIPAVVGISDLTAAVSTGDLVVVDGLRGDIIVEPDEQEREVYEWRSRQWLEHAQALLQNRDLPAVTLDGVRIELLANIEFPGEAAVAIEHGADGIGLYRSEFLFVNRAGLPTEEEQYRVYRSVVETVAPRVVTLRTFDVGGDKFVSSFPLPTELNPALGLRAVRLGLRLPEVFKTQLRAMLRAARHGDVRIMFPMISGLSELRAAKGLLAEARRELVAAGLPAGDPAVGCMIEVPSAVMTADLLAREADFFSIGTNDLIQYTLAIDRGSEHVAHLYHPLHPAVLRAIDRVVRAGREAGIPVGTCGAMAEEPLYVLVLVGLGLDSLSTTPLSLPLIKQILRSCHAARGRDIAEQAMSLPTADEVEQLVREAMERELGDLSEASGMHEAREDLPD